MTSEGDSRIKVAIRVRSLSNNEKDRNRNVEWKLSENKLWQIDPRTEHRIGQVYTFDHVFGVSALTKEIFEVLAKPIIESCLQGFNGTIFAYGQTSSGKTYTMMGEKHDEGIIPMSINHIFNTVEAIQNREFLIRVSYMEIYNEQIHDLLEPKNNNLKIHEDSSGQAYVTLKEEIADTPEKVIAVMKKGEKMRRFGVTDINERSSRSHTIFRIVIESRKKKENDSFNEFNWDDSVQISILNLVDLAGSERVVQTKATGERFKEGCSINKSLFYLGNVISQLSDGTGQYVNFRDSKLTRILRTSLGGNAHTAIICTITPASIEESISTLSFASRAICVKNEPHVNEIVSNECLMRGHAAIVKKLEIELEKARKAFDSSSMKKELEQKEKIISRLKGWIQRDQLQVFSPQNNSRSQRRKTWAAPDFNLMRKRLSTGPLISVPEESKDCDFSMEIDSPSNDDIVFEDNIQCLPGSSNVTFRRGSAGQSNRESIENQSYHYSWHMLSNSGCDDRFSFGSLEGITKRRKLDMEDESDVIAESRKCLQEAILRLNGNNVDLQSYSLLELINELTNIADKKRPMVIANEPSLEEVNKLSLLEELLEKTKSEFEALKIQKNEIESVLKLEQEKFINVESQLKEALEKVEFMSKPTNHKVDFNSEKNLTHLENEYMVQELETHNQLQNFKKEVISLTPTNEEPLLNLETKLLMEADKEVLLAKLEKETMRVKQLEEELEANEVILANLATNEEEMMTEMKELKCSREILGGELKIAIQNLSTLEEENLRIKDEMAVKEKEMSLSAIEHSKKISYLESVIADQKSHLCQLEMSSMENKTVEMVTVSTSTEQAVDDYNGIIEKITMYEQNIAQLEDNLARNLMETGRIVLEKEEFQSLFVSGKEKYKILHVQLDEALANIDNATEKISMYEQHLAQLEENVAKNVMETSMLTSEKEEYKSLLISGKEKYQNLHMQLDEALANLDSTTKKVGEVEILNRQIQKLENELMSRELELDNVNQQLKGLYVELSEERTVKAEMELKLIEIQDSKSHDHIPTIQELLATVKAHEKTIAELQVSLSGKEELRSNLLALEKLVMDTELLLEEERKKSEPLKEEINQLQHELKSLKGEKEKLLIEHEGVAVNSEEIEALRISLEECKSELLNFTLERKDFIADLELKKYDNERLQNQLTNALLDIDTLSKKLIEVASQYDSVKDKESELISLKAELDNVKFSLSVCVQSEEELDNLISVEKKKVTDLQKELSEALAEKKDLFNKKLELTESLEKIEQELASLTEEHTKCVENEIKIIELEDALKEANDKIKDISESKELELENIRKNSKIMISEIEVRMNALREKFSKEVNEDKISSLEELLETEIKKCAVKTGEVESLKISKNRLEEMLKTEKDKVSDLEKQLLLEEEKLQNLNIVLVGQVKEINRLKFLEIDLRKMLFEESCKEEKIKSKNLELINSKDKIEHQLKLVTEQHSTCMENKVKLIATNDELLAKVDILQIKLAIFESQIENLGVSLTAKQDRVSVMEKRNEEISSLLMLEEQKNTAIENELVEVKTALSTSEFNLNQLRSEVSSLKKKLIEEVSMTTQLKTQLETEKKAYLATKEVDGRVLADQGKSVSVLSSSEGTSNYVNTEDNLNEEKENKFKELTDKLEEQEEYIKSFDKAVEKMERRYNLTLDHRLEIQRKAQERESELLNQITELQKRIKENSKSEEEQSNVKELEKEVNRARLIIEENEKKLQAAILDAKTYYSQANDYKKEILRCKQLLHAGVTRTEAKVTECGVQTVPVEGPVIEDIRPCGSGIVQYYKIDLLEQKVKELERDKDFLKKLCRRRHDQREELKLKLEALTGKSVMDATTNKENESLNV